MDNREARTKAMRDTLLGLHVTKWLATAAMGAWMSVPGSVMTLTAFVIADFVTGLLCAIVRKSVDSDKAFRGFVRKVLIVGLVLVMHYAEKALGKEFGIETWISGYFIVIECISIVENCARAGVPIPSALVQVLLKVRDFVPAEMTAAEVEAAFRRADRGRRRAISPLVKERGVAEGETPKPPEL